MNFDRDLLNDLLAKEEDEIHDFKAQWYSPEKKAELVKDLFSFVNTIHHKDCYLLIGVSDDQKVVGVENDKNRLDTQQLTDFLHKLPIANAHTPKVVVESVKTEGHVIDIIVVKETSDVPVYLDEDKHFKGAKRPINAGQIFVRVNDTNTPINETANDGDVERLWKKRFGEDLPILDRFTKKIGDFKNWEYFELKLDQNEFFYDMDPDFRMIITDDDEHRYRTGSFALGQYRLDIDWNWLKLQYRGSIITRFPVVFMDGGRFLTVVPESCYIHSSLINDPIPFRCFVHDSLQYEVEKLIFNMDKTAITPDNYQKKALLENIVIFKNSRQQEQVIKHWNSQYNYIKEKCKPTSEQIKHLKNSLSFDFGKDSYEMRHVESFCEEANVSRFIKTHLQNRK